MIFATYTFAMTGATKAITYQGKTLTVPAVPIAQKITCVFSVPVVTTKGTQALVKGWPVLTGQVVETFDAVVYTDENGRNMTMIHAGGGVFVGFFSLAVEGPDLWSQGVANYLVQSGMVPCEVPAAFAGVLA